jgi:hypothetical protein
MILNRSHAPWAFLVLLVSAGCGVLYLANFHPALLPFHVALPPQFGPVPPIRNTVGGTPLGLIFGIVALLIFLFASALGIRKKKRRWPIGHVQLWLKAHIWLSILTIPLVLFHCGFRHGGAMPTVLLVLYSIVMASGFFGLGMQQIMPRIMTEKLPREVVYEEIPYLRKQLIETALTLRRELRTSARKAAEPILVTAGTSHGAAPAAPSEDSSEQAIADFLDTEGLQFLHSRSTRGQRLEDRKVSDDVFRLLRLNVSPKWYSRVDEVQMWCEDRRCMDVQVRLQHWLHGWLLFHVPVSFALLVMTFWHAYITLIYL